MFGFGLSNLKSFDLCLSSLHTESACVNFLCFLQQIGLTSGLTVTFSRVLGSQFLNVCVIPNVRTKFTIYG